MKNSITAIIGFVLGSAVGAGVAYAVLNKNLETKYSKLAEEEIKSARDAYSKMQKELYDKNVLEKNRIMDDYQNGLASFGYVEEVKELQNQNISQDDSSENLLSPENKGKIQELVNDTAPEVPEPEERPYVKPKDPENNIYIITSEQFGEYNDYDMEDLTYYSNGVVTDNFNNVIENPEELIGSAAYMMLTDEDNDDFTERFVRNENRKTDYEIDIAGYDFFEE